MRTPPNPVVRLVLALLAGGVGSAVVLGLGLCGSAAHATGEHPRPAEHGPTGQAWAADQGVVDQEVVLALVGLGAGMATIGGVVGAIRINVGHD